MATIREQVEELLSAANGRRRSRTVSLNRVLGCLRDLRDNYEFSVEDGGTVPASYGYPASTTVVLAAAIGHRYYLGITDAPAHSASPGRAWHCLQPWTDDGPRGNAANKWANWSRSASVIELSMDQINAILDPDSVLPELVDKVSTDDIRDHYSLGL